MSKRTRSNIKNVLANNDNNIYIKLINKYDLSSSYIDEQIKNEIAKEVTKRILLKDIIKTDNNKLDIDSYKYYPL